MHLCVLLCTSHNVHIVVHAHVPEKEYARESLFLDVRPVEIPRAKCLLKVLEVACGSAVIETQLLNKACLWITDDLSLLVQYNIYDIHVVQYYKLKSYL